MCICDKKKNNNDKLAETVRVAFGEVSAVFMFNEDGKDIVMPTEELLRISDKLIKDIQSLPPH